MNNYINIHKLLFEYKNLPLSPTCRFRAVATILPVGEDGGGGSSVAAKETAPPDFKDGVWRARAAVSRAGTLAAQAGGVAVLADVTGTLTDNGGR